MVMNRLQVYSIRYYVLTITSVYVYNRYLTRLYIVIIVSLEGLLKLDCRDQSFHDGKVLLSRT